MRKDAEKAHKIGWELVVVVIVVVITIYLNAAGFLLNPFQVAEFDSSVSIKQAYNKGTDYVKLTKVSLEFTGYYKLDADGKVVYNCYATELDGNTYFVFVPPTSSGAKLSEPLQNITDYSCIAKICEDEDLFGLVAADYNLTTKEFKKNYGVSSLVLDEARSNRVEMMVIWGLLFFAFLISVSYILLHKKIKKLD